MRKYLIDGAIILGLAGILSTQLTLAHYTMNDSVRLQQLLERASQIETHKMLLDKKRTSINRRVYELKKQYDGLNSLIDNHNTEMTTYRHQCMAEAKLGEFSDACEITIEQQNREAESLNYQFTVVKKAYQDRLAEQQHLDDQYDQLMYKTHELKSELEDIRESEQVTDNNCLYEPTLKAIVECTQQN